MKKVRIVKVSVLLVAMVLLGVMLVGCVPKGYLTGGEQPIIYYTGWINSGSNPRSSLFSEFRYLNVSNDWALGGGNFYFRHGSNLHFLSIERHSSYIHSISVFRDGMHIGDFYYIQENWRSFERNVQLGRVFLYEEYLFYFFNRRQIIGRRPMQNVAERNEFFRFCLLTGENEEISLTKFVETLQSIDSNWVINPNYRGEK